MNRRKLLGSGAALGMLALTGACTTLAAETTPASIQVYGPGGPAPAMKVAALAFERKSGTRVTVTAGPAPRWMGAARVNADIIFSGSENMMTEFSHSFGGQIDPTTIEPLYIRPSTILVRPGNPKNIEGIRSLAAGNHRIMVVAGAGQVGMWEDVAARSGDRELLAGFRSNIAAYASNSGLALERWKNDPSIDAWLIWNHWQVANPEIADQVSVEPDLVIWRPMDVALTQQGRSRSEAVSFLQFLKSDEAREIFEGQGWKR